MKRYWFFMILLSGLFLTSSCVKDELPGPGEPDKPEYAKIVINELIAKDVTNPYFVDASGSAADWVELYNTGNKAINVAGMYITDKEGDEAEWQQIPVDDETVTTIPPAGYLVLICGAADASGADLETQINDGKVFINMGISASKDSVITLFDPDKNQVDRSGNFNGNEDDKSFGRDQDGSSTWVTMAKKTPGAPNDNGGGVVVGKLVINEFMVSNNSWDVPGDNGDQPDWIEIYNTGDTQLDMGGWYVTDALDTPDKYQLPADTKVEPHGFLVIICDGTGEGLHTNFKLSSGGEDLGISKNGVDFEESYTFGDGADLPSPKSDHSLGRDKDGVLPWVDFAPDGERKPTPGTSNN